MSKLKHFVAGHDTQKTMNYGNHSLDLAMQQMLPNDSFTLSAFVWEMLLRRHPFVEEAQ